MSNQTGFTTTTNFTHVEHGADLCKHVQKQGLSVGVGYFYEKDSCGYVFVEIVCKRCKDKTQKKIDESLVCCDDCGSEKPSKVVRAWKWYDFYAPQGDEPRMVCTDCWELPPHQLRMKKDDDDYRFEHGIPDDDEQDQDNNPDLVDDPWYCDDEEEDDFHAEEERPDFIVTNSLVVYRRDGRTHINATTRWSTGIQQICVNQLRFL